MALNPMQWGPAGLGVLRADGRGGLSRGKIASIVDVLREPVWEVAEGWLTAVEALTHTSQVL